MERLQHRFEQYKAFCSACIYSDSPPILLCACAGFLTTGDSNAPGNYALLDVVAALRWIQENIRPFGGNSSDVTMVGQGHGAVMANLLLLSPITRGQFLLLRTLFNTLFWPPNFFA